MDRKKVKGHPGKAPPRVVTDHGRLALSTARASGSLRHRLPLIEAMQDEVQLSQLTRLAESQSVTSLDEVVALLKQLVEDGELPETVPAATPREHAQDLAYQAYEEQGDRRQELAAQALAMDADCADAYLIQALNASTAEDAEGLYRQAIAAAERATAPKLFRTRAGNLWDRVETRPYVRARLGLALCLERQGKDDEAAGHYQELLRLSRDDNVGARYPLLRLLLRQGQDAPARALLAQFSKDPTAEFAYGRALVAFRQGGDGKTSRDALKQAVEGNPHVPALLLSESPPGMPPEYVGLGDHAEALAYVAGSGQLWRDTTGALAWLAADLVAGGATGSIPQALAPPKGWQLGEVWNKLTRGIHLRGEQAQVARVLHGHLEFVSLWERGIGLTEGEFLVGETDPARHIMLHALVEKQLDTGEPPEVREALDAMLSAGARRHEACHVLLSVLAEEMHTLVGRKGSSGRTPYRARLAYLSQLGHELAAGNWPPPAPKVKAPCPCGSGRQARHCCAKSWPPLPVISDPIPPAPGSEPTPPRPGAVLLLTPDGIAPGKFLSWMGQEHLWVVVDSLAAIAGALERAGDLDHAMMLLTRAVQVAEPEAAVDDVPELFIPVLHRLLNFCLEHDGYEPHGVMAAQHLAALTNQPELYRMHGMFLRFKLGKASTQEMEQALRATVETFPGDGGVQLVLAGFLLDDGRAEEAAKIYRAVTTLAGKPGQQEAVRAARKALKELDGSF